MSLSHTRQIALNPVVEAFTTAVTAAGSSGAGPDDQQRSNIMYKLNLIAMASSMAGPDGVVEELGQLGGEDASQVYVKLKNFVNKGAVPE